MLDRDTLFSLRPYDRNERKELGRKKWVENKKYDPKDASTLHTATNIQMDILCNGTQIRVRFDFNEFVHYWHEILLISLYVL